MTTSPVSTLTSTGRHLRILYAEDVPELRELITVLLGGGGHTVETANDGNEALRKVFTTAKAYDLVITDHHMPGMNGLELVGQLRELAYPGKIVVFSSELSPEVHERYARLRVDHILPKPIFPDTLRDLVAGL